MGTLQHNINLVCGLYENIKKRVNNISDEFNLDAGVRQGCYFTFAFNDILRMSGMQMIPSY